MTDKAIEAACFAYRNANTCHQAEAMRAAILAYEQAMWRPIEEAPKDGGRFLVATTQQLVHEAYYLDNSLTPWPWKGIKPASCKILMNLFKPTHYRPLPPPPGKEG